MKINFQNGMSTVSAIITIVIASGFIGSGSYVLISSSDKQTNSIETSNETEPQDLDTTQTNESDVPNEQSSYLADLNSQSNTTNTTSVLAGDWKTRCEKTIVNLNFASTAATGNPQYAAQKEFFDGMMKVNAQAAIDSCYYELALDQKDASACLDTSSETRAEVEAIATKHNLVLDLKTLESYRDLCVLNVTNRYPEYSSEAICKRTKSSITQDQCISYLK